MEGIIAFRSASVSFFSTVQSSSSEDSKVDVCVVVVAFSVAVVVVFSVVAVVVVVSVAVAE